MVLQLLELVLQMAAKAIYIGIYFHTYSPYVESIWPYVESNKITRVGLHFVLSLVLRITDVSWINYRDQCRTQHDHLPATDVVKRLDGCLQCFGVGPMQSDPPGLIAFVDRPAEIGAFFPIKVGIELEDEPQWADLELAP